MKAPVRAPVQARPAMERAVLLPAGALAFLLSGCAGAGHRYPEPGVPAPVAWADTLPMAEPAGSEGGDDVAQMLDESLTDQPGFQLSLSRRVAGIPPALNVDAFDETVPSAWFEPRISGGGFGPAQAAAGPPFPAPDTLGPLTVVAGKIDGVTPGFTVRDQKGDIYLLKFDPPGMPGLASGADVVSSRIFWAAGYHVPKDVVISIDPERLLLDPEAEVETADGERAMTPADVEAALGLTDVEPDGRVGALASLFLQGTPKGPFRFKGRRSDDPNDHYAHENRRELRGVWVLAAWINHVDLRIQNTLDMYVDPPGYLKHHFIDFATTLGSGSIRSLNPREGQEYAVDLAASMGRLVTLGLYRAGWEGTDGDPIHPSLGWLSGRQFDPAGWKPFYPAESLRRLTPRDGYWGARIVAAFTPDHLRAIVEEARYPQAAADTLVAILVERQHRTLRYWFGQVAPVEDVAANLEGDRLSLSFRDLGVDADLWSPEQTEYRLHVVGSEEEWGKGAMERSSEEIPARASRRQNLDVHLPPSVVRRLGKTTLSDPLVLGLSVYRSGSSARPAHIRLSGDGEGGVRVTGLIH